MTKPQQFQDMDDMRTIYDRAFHAYEVKDSGAQAEFAGGGVRDTNEGKPRFDLLRPEGVPYMEQFLTRCAIHMAKGADKYEARNWEKFEDYEALDRARESAARHLEQWLAGEVDEDHAAAVFFNLLAAETILYKLMEGLPVVKPWLTPAPDATRASHGHQNHLVDMAGS
jgi:hypothetical protein